MVCIKCCSCDTLKICQRLHAPYSLVSFTGDRLLAGLCDGWHSEWLHVNFDLLRCIFVESKCECAAGMLSSMFSCSLWRALWESIIVKLIDFLLFWHQLIVVSCTLCVYIFFVYSLLYCVVLLPTKWKSPLIVDFSKALEYVDGLHKMELWYLKRNHKLCEVCCLWERSTRCQHLHAALR